MRHMVVDEAQRRAMAEDEVEVAAQALAKAGVRGVEGDVIDLADIQAGIRQRGRHRALRQCAHRVDEPGEPLLLLGKYQFSVDQQCRSSVLIALPHSAGDA
jgi:hypothetical protein